MEDNRITKLGAPVSKNDAATKEYVDSKFNTQSTQTSTQPILFFHKIEFLNKVADNIIINVDIPREHVYEGLSVENFVINVFGIAEVVKLFPNIRGSSEYVDNNQSTRIRLLGTCEIKTIITHISLFYFQDEGTARLDLVIRVIREYRPGDDSKSVLGKTIVNGSIFIRPAD